MFRSGSLQKPTILIAARNISRRTGAGRVVIEQTVCYLLTAIELSCLGKKLIKPRF